MSADASDAAALAAEASGAAETAADATDAAGEMADAADESGGSLSPIDLLLATEPDESPADYEELPEHTAHAIIGIKKMLNEAVGGKLDRGTPAIENFARAGLSVVTADDGEQVEQADRAGRGADGWGDVDG